MHESFSQSSILALVPVSHGSGSTERCRKVTCLPAFAAGLHNRREILRLGDSKLSLTATHHLPPIILECKQVSSRKLGRRWLGLHIPPVLSILMEPLCVALKAVCYAKTLPALCSEGWGSYGNVRITSDHDFSMMGLEDRLK